MSSAQPKFHLSDTPPGELWQILQQLPPSDTAMPDTAGRLTPSRPDPAGCISDAISRQRAQVKNPSKLADHS